MRESHLSGSDPALDAKRRPASTPWENLWLLRLGAFVGFAIANQAVVPRLWSTSGQAV